MKTFKKALFYALSMLLATACTEIPPEIHPVTEEPVGASDTVSLEAQDRRVLIEEFTGVRCVNCPAGAAAIQRLIDQHEGRVVAVSVHAGFFARPYAESRYDFRTTDGDQLQSYLGEPFGYPTAVVNRRQFDGERDLQLGQSLWPGYVEAELAVPPEVYLDISTGYDPAIRELVLTVVVEAAEDIQPADVRLTVALIENGVVDRQLTPEGEKDDYVHNHVLRDIITPYDGQQLETPLSMGENRSYSFETSLPPDWQAGQCLIVAFVHSGGEDKRVLQALEAGVTE